MNKHKKIFTSVLLLALVLVPAISWAASGHITGRILLQVEQNGEAWYVEPTQGTRIYMRNGDVAYSVMRDFGLGITNADLGLIPIGVDERIDGLDTDGDGLLDVLEQALYLDASDMDSDDDGYTDGEEVWNGYNPRGTGAVALDWNLADRLAGRIVLQVEQNGEAWYINPVDNRRYYMPDGDAAYQLMRYLGLGITDENLSAVPVSDYTVPDDPIETMGLVYSGEIDVACADDDMSCLISALDSNQFASMSYTFNVLGALFLGDATDETFNTRIDYVVGPVGSGGAAFWSHYSVIEVELSDAAREELYADGYTEIEVDEVESQVRESMQTFLNYRTFCTAEDAQTIRATLLAWADGKFSTGDYDGMRCIDNGVEIGIGSAF